jgi:hypothetical protein
MKYNSQFIVYFFKNCAWTLPFIAFCAGYFSLQFLIGEAPIITPNFIGKNILQATKISSDLKLNIRIIAEKEVIDTPAGTIIKQNPLPDAAIKSHQSIFVIITKLPEPIKAPSIINASEKEIENICKTNGLKSRIYYIPHTYPAGRCFAQIPAVNHTIEDKILSCYIATSYLTQRLFPDFTQKNIYDVIQFLKVHNIDYEVYYKNQKININCLIR